MGEKENIVDEYVSAQEKIPDNKVEATITKEDAYDFKEEEDEDFGGSFRSLKTERRKSNTLRESQFAVERRGKKRGSQVQDEDQDDSHSKGHPTEKGIYTIIRNI